MTRHLILLNRLLHHPAIEVSPNFDDHAMLIKSHDPRIRVVELHAYTDDSATISLDTIPTTNAPLSHSALATSSTTVQS